MNISLIEARSTDSVAFLKQPDEFVLSFLILPDVEEEHRLRLLSVNSKLDAMELTT